MGKQTNDTQETNTNETNESMVAKEMEEALGVGESEEQSSSENNNSEKNTNEDSNSTDSTEKQNDDDKKGDQKQEEKKDTESKNQNITLTPTQLEVNKEIAKIEIEIEKLESENSVDTDEFYNSLDTHLTEEEQQLEFDNKSEYLKVVAKKEKEFIKSHSKEEQIQQAKAKKEQLEGVFERQTAITNVVAKYPDYNHETILEYFQKNLSQSEQEKIYEQSSSYEDVYENTYKKYIGSNPKNVKTTPAPKIPDVNDVRKKDIENGKMDEGFKTHDEELREALGL